MENLSDITQWKKRFGLLPIHLNPRLGNSQFLMLNGGQGDFCFQTAPQSESEELFYEYSWSTNTKNYVLLDGENINVYNWNEKKNERISKDKVQSNLSAFYNYLHSKSFKSANDVVPFILSIFRQLRNVTTEKNNPTYALNLLFRLLISLEETSFTSTTYSKWGISEVPFPSQFEYFVESIKRGVKAINPNLDLILRHVSGGLFQEAHREVIFFNVDRDLFGGVSSKLPTQSIQYSSIHYTPQYLARAIVERSLKLINLDQPIIRIFDPSCGSSEFLVEALKQLESLGFEGKVVMTGWDTSAIAVDTSNFLLHYEKRTQWEDRLEFEVTLVEDSLLREWRDDNDIILMNPPFVSWNLLQNKDSRDALIDTLGTAYKKGKPNQSSAFFYKAAKHLSPNGVLGCILPSSILTFDAYDKLRKEVQEVLSLEYVARLGNFVFEDALTDVSFLVGKKPQVDKIPKVIWCNNVKGIVPDALRDLRKMEFNDEVAIDEKQYSIYIPKSFPFIQDSWKVLSYKENSLLIGIDRLIINGLLSRISEIFTVRQGAITGVKNTFRISELRFESLAPSEQALFRPVVTSKSFNKGQLIVNEYIWFPYNKDGIIVRSEEELGNLSFGVNDLLPNKEQLSRRSGISEWWGLTWPRNWQFNESPRLFSSRFGNSNTFGYDTKGKCVIEEGNAFIPKKKFQPDDYFFYLACFSSSVFDQLLSIYSKQILAGFDLGNAQIKNIPVPNVHNENVRESEPYQRLVDFGRQLHEGNSYIRHSIDDLLDNYFYQNNR